MGDSGDDDKKGGKKGKGKSKKKGKGEGEEAEGEGDAEEAEGDDADDDEDEKKGGKKGKGKGKDDGEEDGSGCPAGTLVYHKGSHCCKEKVDKNGKDITYDSKHCKGNNFIVCPL